MDSHRQERLPDSALVASGAAMAGLAVALGAFGAHALKGHISSQALGWWQTAVQYQMWHALALLVLGVSGMRKSRVPALLMGVGAIVFAATLYALAIGGPKWLGAVTPLGGLAMIVGWALLGIAAVTAPKR
jgi:uncharacterized membrane protein YgdD (TMEM256/DUF423 family)